jgi:hypothetical protein
MKFIVKQTCSLLILAFISSLLSGCVPKLSSSSILELADETEAQGCREIGIIAGKSHWGGMTGQDLSLEVAKKRALNLAKARGATHVLWLKLNKGFFGASVSGKIYFCQSNTTAMVENAKNSQKTISLSKSVTTKKEIASGSVAVMRFESAGVDSSISMVITDIFTNQIQANGKYRVMERSQMNKILNEQGFQNSSICNSTECAVEIGRLLSIDKMFIGSIGKLGESWVITIRIISIQTGEILSNLSKQVIGKTDDLSSAAILMANEFSQ